jgi:hypothetical protein
VPSVGSNTHAFARNRSKNGDDPLHPHRDAAIFRRQNAQGRMGQRRKRSCRIHVAERAFMKT